MSKLRKEIPCSLSLLTQKSPLVCQDAVTWIGQSGIGKHGLVAFETQKTYTHLGYDAYEDGSEAIVKGKWGLSSDSHDSFDQASILTLEKCSDTRSFLIVVLKQSRALDIVSCKKIVRPLTLAFCDGDESCMLTLTVSGRADEGRVVVIGTSSSYPEDDIRGPPSFLLHLPLLLCQITVFTR